MSQLLQLLVIESLHVVGEFNGIQNWCRIGSFKTLEQTRYILSRTSCNYLLS